jgi:predicted nucleotidyltransferase
MRKNAIEEYNQEIASLTDQIKQKFNPRKIILFGSCAQGRITPDSDIDMLIIKDTQEDFFARTYRLWKTIRTTQPFEPIVFTSKEINRLISLGDPFIKEVMETGKVLYAA